MIVLEIIINVILASQNETWDSRLLSKRVLNVMELFWILNSRKCKGTVVDGWMFQAGFYSAFPEILLCIFPILYIFSLHFDKPADSRIAPGLLLCSWPCAAKRIFTRGINKVFDYLSSLSISLSLSLSTTPLATQLCVSVASSLGFSVILPCRGNQFT